MRWTNVVALAAVGTLSLAACGGGNPSATKNSESASTGSGATTGSSSSPTSSAPMEQASAGLMPDAKGPAPEIPGAKKGGTLTVQVTTAPETFDPSRQYYQDVNAIDKLLMRTLTTWSVRDGKSVLVPDLATDLGEVSKDGLTWTFHLKDGLKYEDGSPITAQDVAYGVKRSFAHKELPDGPYYQNDYLKGGDKYQGPFSQPNANFPGVTTPNDKTVVFHLRKKWATLPYFASFTQVSPIPKAKDTKENYGDHPIASGPYKFADYNKGTSLTLVKNTNWDPATDPARHQFPDKIEFKFGVDQAKTAAQIMASNGPDATTMSYDGVDASIYDQATGAKKDQVVTGPGPCVSFINLDMRKMPKAVREAVAVAYPIDQTRKAAGLTPLDYAPATTISAPQVPGFTSYTLPNLTGQGPGDQAKAKEMLKKAGKLGFELSWYYSSDRPSSVKTNLVRKQYLEKAGFKVHDIGVSLKEIRAKISDPKAPVNMMQGPAGWCYDWPSGDSIYPPILSSNIVDSGQSTGFLNEKSVDAEMNRISALPIEKQGPEWSAFDKMVESKYLPLIPYYISKASYIFGTKVHHVVNDPNAGMPEMSSIWVG
jgi:peptide/nickel transport system substrate-binding protein